MVEEFRFGQRPFHGFLEPVFHLVEATDFIPANLRHFNVNLPQGRRLNVPYGFLEIFHADLHFLKHLWWEGFFIEVNFRQVAAQGSHGRFTNECSEVGPDEAVGVVQHPSNVKVVRYRHLTGVNVHDLAATFAVGNANLDFTVKATRSPKRRVQSVSSVGRSDDDHVVAAVHAVHQRQHLRNDTALDLTRDVFAFRANGIDFIDEHDGGSVVGGLVEDLSQLFFRFSVILRDDFRAVDALEVGVGFGSNSLGDHRFSGSRWTVQQHAFRGVNAKPTEEFRMLEWELNHFTNFLELLADTTDIFVRDAFRLTNVFLGNSLVLDHDFRVRGNHNDAFWHGLYDSERKSLSEQGHPGDENSVASNHRPLGQPSFGKAFNARPKFHLLLVGHDGRDGQLRASFGINFLHGDPVTKAHAGVFPDDAVHADDVHFGVFRSAAPVNGRCGTFFTADFHEVARFEVKPHLRGDTGPSEAHVGRDGF